MELRHPNLIQVHEYVPDTVQPYFVMDFFPAIHLRLPIAMPAAVRVSPSRRCTGSSSRRRPGLAYMHDKGWVHRDVKPENILVNKAGEVRVIDYALAMQVLDGLRKLLGGKPPRQGTPSYMSPEQIRCEPPAPSADIYSFGITCYELACGRQPFRANSPTDLLNKHLSERPARSRVQQGDHPRVRRPDDADAPEEARPTASRASTSSSASFSRIRIFKDDPDPQRRTAATCRARHLATLGGRRESRNVQTRGRTSRDVPAARSTRPTTDYRLPFEAPDLRDGGAPRRRWRRCYARARAGEEAAKTQVAEQIRRPPPRAGQPEADDLRQPRAVADRPWSRATGTAPRPATTSS